MRQLLDIATVQFDKYIRHINLSLWEHHAYKSGREHLLPGHHEFYEDHSEAYAAVKLFEVQADYFDHQGIKFLAAVSRSVLPPSGPVVGGEPEVQFVKEFRRKELGYFYDDPALKQNARTILCALEHFILSQREGGVVVEVIHGRSDNCAPQAKCAYFFIGCNVIARRLHVHIHWRYSCPGHGHGEVDGWNGVAKHHLNQGMKVQAWEGDTAAQAVAYLNKTLQSAALPPNGKEEIRPRTVRFWATMPLHVRIFLPTDALFYSSPHQTCQH